MLLSLLLNGQLDFNTALALIVADLIVIFLILPFHEWAHAFTASLLGDKGIKARGRLSLNPISHIDPVGALCMILIGFGWAKPVPVDPRYFKNPKLGMAVSAFMGPMANIIAALAGLLILNGIVAINPLFVFSDIGHWIYMFLVYFASLNVGLAVFNLIPIPPLDGSKVLFLFLPDNAVRFCYQYQNIFFVALFALMYSGVLSTPIGWAQDAILSGLNSLAELPFSMFA